MRLRLASGQQLGLFFTLAFAIGWAVFIPLALHRTPTSRVAFVGLFAPTLAALTVAGLTEGREGVRLLIARLGWWRFGWQWYGVAVLLLPALYAVAVLAQGAWSQPPTSQLWLGRPWYFLALSYLFLVIIVSGEEIGWRGFALPLLQARWPHPVRNSMLLGAVWGLWHGALYLMPGPGMCPFPLFMVLTIALSVLYTMLFSQAGGSLIPALLLHASTDIGPRFLDFARFTVGTWTIIVGLVSLVAAACAANRGLMKPTGRAPAPV
jgi:membrane protease YdiL (CAAX protease family)